MVFRIRLAALSRGFCCFFMPASVRHYMTVWYGDKCP
jgi:hypothetical protein